MLLVPEGEFLMGNDQGRSQLKSGIQNEAPAHRVHVRAFYIDKFEVTNHLYLEFCKNAGHPRPPEPVEFPNYLAKLDHPVINVSWEDVKAFAEWAGKRLPTEAEWERAARGDDSRIYPWGSDYQTGKANLQDASKLPHPSAVGTFEGDQSPFGVMDMAGNVFEWVQDRYALYPGNRSELPDSERFHRVVRGGGFLLGKEIARVTNRGARDPKLDLGKRGDSFVGFRCSVDVDSIKNARPVESPAAN